MGEIQIDMWRNFINNPAIINYLFLMKIFSNMTSTTLPHLTPLFFLKKGWNGCLYAVGGLKGRQH